MKRFCLRSFCLTFAPPLLFTGLLAAGVTAAVNEQQSFAHYSSALRAVRVVVPAGQPELGQESIDLAMEIFSIDAPAGLGGPRYEGDLEDRGLTTGGTINTHKDVAIGPAAFTSWSILGSTLGHEIEVHAKQSFLKIIMVDKFNKTQLALRKRVGKVIPGVRPSVKELFEDTGTWAAEREAYQYEIRSAERFQLDPEERDSIQQVMNFYYPEQVVKNSEAQLGALK